MKEKIIRLTEFNKGKYDNIYKPHREYRVDPGTVCIIKYPDGRVRHAVATVPDHMSSVASECLKRKCIFNNQDRNQVCSLTSMICFCKRPHVYFKPLEDGMEEI